MTFYRANLEVAIGPTVTRFTLPRLSSTLTRGQSLWGIPIWITPLMPTMSVLLSLSGQASLNRQKEARHES